MSSAYTDTVRQLLDIAPVVFATPHFALKGGTALNLFLHDLPRLSVDIDVVFTNHSLGLFVVEETEDGSFRASAAAAAIHTEAETLEELNREIRDAVLCHFDPGQAPPWIRLHHVKQELLAL
jgi:hypothetical protein